jgi:CPA1 family monovalent cation:H+ antiporter
MSIARIEILLLIAAVVAMLARRFRFPYTVGLVFTGIAISFLSFGQNITMTKELVFSVLLPPLIFEAAIFLPWNELRKEAVVVISMATVGVVLAAGVVTIGMHFVAGWPLLPAAIFGALIAATDPVSVIATFKESGVHGRLRLLVEAESLFNDGTAAVVFGVLLAIAEGMSPSPGSISLDVIRVVGGGMFCGGLVALVVLYIAGKTTDHLVEITFTTVTAYGSFLLAEHFHCSGVLSTLTAGLIAANRGQLGAISPKGRESVEAFWEYIAFVSNSLIFLLIGIHEAEQDFSALWVTAIIAIALVKLGRAVAVYPICLLFSHGKNKVPSSYQHIMFWGGLRGALSLALALGLPVDLPYRNQIVTMAFAVVAFSVIVQGLTMIPLLRHFGELDS